MARGLWISLLVATAATLSVVGRVRLESERARATLPPLPPEVASNRVVYRITVPADASSGSKTTAATSKVLSSVVDSDWPALFGPRGNSTSPETGLRFDWPGEGPPVVWRKSIGTGYSSPVVAGGQVALHHRRGDLEWISLLDAKTGTEVWETSTKTTYECRFPYSSGPYATPCFCGPYLLAVTAEGRLLALHRSNGKVAWERDFQSEFQVKEPLFAVGASPCCDGERVYLNVGGRSSEAGIVAFRLSDGELLWRATRDGASYATPVRARLHDQEFLFVFTAQSLVAIDPATGVVDWSIPFGVEDRVDQVNAVTPLVQDNLVFVTCGPGVGSLCVRILPDRTFEEVWRDRRVLDSQFNNLTVHDGCVFGFTSKWRRSSAFRCVELASGKIRWEWPSQLQRGSSLAVDGHLLLWGEHGDLAAMELNADEAIVVAQAKEPLLDSPTYSAPAISQGRLFLRNEREVICLDLRVPAANSPGH